MNKGMIVICDEEADYAIKLAEYGNLTYSTRQRFMAFDNLQLLMEYLATNSIEVLVIADTLINDEIRLLMGHSLVILTEEYSEDSELKTIFKYQSAETIINKIVSHICDTKDFSLNRRSTNLMAVYSPIGGCYKTTFSIVLGQLLSKKAACLYLNLEEYSGLDNILGEPEAGGLSDLFYVFQTTNQQQFLNTLHSLSRKFHELSYIMPTNTPVDIKQISIDAYKGMFEVLAYNSGFDYVIVDIGSTYSTEPEFLELFDSVWLLSRDDILGKAKISTFIKNLEANGKKDFINKLRPVILPYDNKATNSFRSNIDTFIWSDFGDYVRTLIDE